METNIDTTRTAAGEINTWPEMRLKLRLSTGAIIFGTCEFDLHHNATWVLVWQSEKGTDEPVSVRTDSIVTVEPAR